MEAAPAGFYGLGLNNGIGLPGSPAMGIGCSAYRRFDAFDNDAAGRFIPFHPDIAG